MASAAELAVGASNYQGSSELGGGSFGAVKLDTRPIEDLAKYTFLYNRSEYDQRQKDVEAAAAEIADYTSYDLTTGIPKDAKLLQEKYDKLTAYVRENPNALDYRNKKEWAEYKKMRNDLENDLKSAKVRNTIYTLRKKEITDNTDEADRELRIQELNQEVESTDIRTPINHSQQYADNSVKLPPSPELTFDVTKTGPNAVVIRDYKVFNVSKARSNGDVFAIISDKDIDPTTPQGKRDIISQKKNFWLQGAEAFNSVLNAKDETTGEFLYKTKITDANGNVTYSINEQKLSKMPKNILNLVKETNEYLKRTKAEISAGTYKDKFEKPITFGSGAMNESDYDEINYADGISPEELALVAQYAQWNGDQYKTDVKQNDNAIQMRGQDISAATQRRGQDLDLLNSREGRALQKTLAEMKPTAGKTVAEQKAEYPILKTDEMLEAIGGKPKSINDLTPEQKSRIQAQMDGVSLDGAIISVKGSVITVKTEKSGTTKIQADDIAKSYFDNINTIDAGKENVQRIFYVEPSKRGDGKKVDEFGVEIK